MTFLADGFRQVDNAANLEKLATCLSLMERLPDFQTYKKTSYDALVLGPDSKVADLACGLGFDLPRLKQLVPGGSVTGFDLSESFVKAAQNHVVDVLGTADPSITVRQGDIHALDCEPDLFDAARIDRSLQHIPDPATAIGEMARIVRPGGIVCAAEPDWSSFVVGSDLAGISRHAEDAFRNGFLNPMIGRELIDHLGGHLSITHHSVHPILLKRLADAEIIFDLSVTLQRCVSEKRIPAAEAETFYADLEERDRSHRFFALLNIHVVAGRKR
ncbi:MAG: methyltransferase domain-containing protein [Pseudomonadota bacterium]